MDMKEEIGKRRKEKWFELHMGIEVLGISRDIAENSLAEHVRKLSSEDGVFVYEEKFSDIQKVDKPLRDVDEAYAQVASVKLFAKNLSTLMHVVMLYGPSSIEVIGPDKRDISVGEVQHVANNLASIVHQFAAAGVGGIVITPEKKK
jgi:hypothetical protein